MSEEQAMQTDQSSSDGSIRQRFKDFKMKAPWYVVTGVLRLSHGFKVIGEENIPKRGPFILALNEYSLLAMAVSGWISIVLLQQAMEETPDPDAVQSFMMEDMWSFGYFGGVPRQGPAQIRPLVPQGAGRLALGLLDGIKALRKGGMVVINPEGEPPWDGRPLPPGKAVAWMALHTGVPILPALASVGAYDSWPIWRARPYLRGRMTLNVGKPFKLVDEPLKQVTPEDVRRANERIQEEFCKARYLPSTQADWAGPPSRNGSPVGLPIELEPAHAPVVPWPDEHGEEIKPAKRGVGRLLWRCPMCHTEEAIIQESRLLGPDHVRCRACDTKWSLRRIYQKDFRLKVVEGHPDMVGLDMALSAWYDEARKGFEPLAREISGFELREGEVAYLETDGVKLVPARPNPLFDDYTGREPPRTMPMEPRLYADWESIGEGRVVLTNQRLLWQGEERELDFDWACFQNVSILPMGSLMIRYGAATYRLNTTWPIPLQWLTYAGTMAKASAELDGREVETHPF